MHFYQVLLACLIRFMSVQAISNIQIGNDIVNALLDKGDHDEEPKHEDDPQLNCRPEPTNTIKKAKSTTTITPSPTCVASGGQCDLNNPGACCSQVCISSNPPAPPICL